MFGKPVFVFGSSWYGHSGLCRPVLEHEDAAALIMNGFSLEYERVLRFIHYLRFRFYSFGEMTTRKARYPDGTSITATTHIKYYEMRLAGKLRRLQKTFKPISTESPLFDRYRVTKAAGAAKVTKTPAPKSPAPKSPAQAAAPAKPAPAPAKLQPGEAKFIADARNAMSAKNYRLAASCLEQAARVSSAPIQHYRAAAEALVEAGDTAAAINLLKKTALEAKDSAPIEKRIKELSRSPLMRKLLPEKKYGGLERLRQ